MWRHKKNLSLSGRVCHPEDAFSLMELLVVIAITGLIALVVLSTLRGGLRLYDRIKASSNQQLEVMLALESMEKKIRNTCPFASIGFNGDARHFCFPSLITLPAQTNATALCQIVYDFNAASNSLTEKTLYFHPEFNAVGSSRGGAPRKLAHLEDLKFSYCYWNAKSQACEWKNSWIAGEGMPLGVKLTISLRNGRGGVKQTVWIPVAHY